jgi:uncharacterized membrane protein SpoIIM required for sporulation
MKEITFLRKNHRKWQEVELFVEQASDKDPDKLAELFVELTDDLSYARTFYPNSKTAEYLNDLAVKVHQAIYKNKREGLGKYVAFWRNDLPMLFFQYRKELLISLLVFVVSALIAVVSQLHDSSFGDLILGSGYVDMTIQNIQDGDPMGVYKSGNELSGFLGIATNNIKVSYISFAFGALFSIGAAYIIFSNGVMVGSFFYLFYAHGAESEWWSFVWLHGTLEIWSIVIGGAAGLVFGNGFLFPKSYSRGESFKRSARDGLRIVIGVTPLLIVAGFIEGFITRLTNMPHWMNILIIGGSLLFIVWYFIAYPFLLSKKPENQLENAA